MSKSTTKRYRLIAKAGAGAIIALSLSGCAGVTDTSELENEIALVEGGDFGACMDDSYLAATKLQEARNRLEKLQAGPSETDLSEGLQAAARARALRAEAETTCSRASLQARAEDAERIAKLTDELSTLSDRLYDLESRREILRGVTFDVNSASLTPEARTVLDEQVEKLLNKGRAVEIAGFSSTTGTKKRNMELSQLRANAVRDYLIGNGVSATLLTANGYGASNPIATNDTAEGRRANQRIELRYTP